MIRLSFFVLAACCVLLRAPVSVSAGDPVGVFPETFESLVYQAGGFGEFICLEEGAVYRAEIHRNQVEGNLYEMSLTLRAPGRLSPEECEKRGEPCVNVERTTRRLLTSEERDRVLLFVEEVFTDPPIGPTDICPLWDPCRIDSFEVDGNLLPPNPCHDGPVLERFHDLLVLLQDLSEGPVYADVNGDINAAGDLTIADAIGLLDWLFRSGPTPAAVPCAVDFDCGGPVVVFENGDVNGDASRDISDVVYLLRHLFSGGAMPEPICSC